MRASTADVVRSFAHAHPCAVAETHSCARSQPTSPTIASGPFFNTERRPELAVLPIQARRQRGIVLRSPDDRAPPRCCCARSTARARSSALVGMSLSNSSAAASATQISNVGFAAFAVRRLSLCAPSISAGKRRPARASSGVCGTSMLGVESFDVAVFGRLRRVPEERRHRIKILLRERIELVIVTRRAIQRHAQAHPARRASRDRWRSWPGSLRRSCRPRSSSCCSDGNRWRPFLVVVRIGKQIAGELFEGELVERHVAC